MKVIKKWFNGLLQDENGNPSSKRLVGLLAALSLCVALFIDLYTNNPINDAIVTAVAALAFGALGLSSVDKIWGKSKGE